jgi:cell division protein FtsQ
MPKPAPVKRFNWRLLVAILGGFLLFVSTAMATRRVQSMLFSDEHFFLESMPDLGTPGIHVEGNRYTARDRIVQIFSPDFNRSIFRIPLAERRRRLLAIDWIEDATVLRIWPNQLIVKVRERKPAAFAKLPVGVAGQYRYVLIDAQGVLLGVPRQRFDLPVMTGATEEQTEAERRTRVLAMQRLLQQLGPSGAAMILDVNVASLQDLRVSAKIDGHNVELWLGDRNYLARFHNFTNHFDEILQQADGASVFDLRLEDRIMTVR